MGARNRNFYFNLVCRYGYHDEARHVQELYLAGRNAAELVERTSLIGPASYAEERMAAYQEAGVTILNVNPVGESPPADLEQLRDRL